MKNLADTLFTVSAHARFSNQRESNDFFFLKLPMTSFICRPSPLKELIYKKLNFCSVFFIYSPLPNQLNFRKSVCYSKQISEDMPKSPCSHDCLACPQSFSNPHHVSKLFPEVMWPWARAARFHCLLEPFWKSNSCHFFPTDANIFNFFAWIFIQWRMETELESLSISNP